MDEWLARYCGESMSDKSYGVKFINGKRCIVDGNDILEVWTEEKCLKKLRNYQANRVDMQSVFKCMYDEIAKCENAGKQQWMQENTELFTKVFDENPAPSTEPRKPKLGLFK
jgi:hypothetical protein